MHHVRSVIRALAIGLIAILLMNIGVPAGAQTSAGQTRSYQLAITTDVLISTLDGKERRSRAWLEVEYVWQSEGRSRTLVLKEIGHKSEQEGKVDLHTRMSGQQFTLFKGGEPKTISVADAPDEIRAMLQDSFGPPLVKITYDESGKPIAREMMGKGGATEILDEGLIANLTLFHPVRPGDKDEWESDAAMSMGSEGLVRGKLVYRKVRSGPNPVYAMTGTLTNERYAAPDGKVVMTGNRYVVTGEQSYDPAARVWQEGKLHIDVSYKLTFPNGRDVGTAKGTIVAELKGK
jgi:hypothetical protein